MIIINTPHNPSGQVFSANDLQQLVAVTRNTDIIILSDEVYEHVVLTVNRTTVWLHPQLAERSVIISSFGKPITLPDGAWVLCCAGGTDGRDL